MVGRAALLIVEDHLRRRAAHLDLRAHPLQARSKRFNLLLLVRVSRLEVLLQLRDGRFLFLHCAVLFEKLVEQHRIHSFVAHSVNFPCASRATRSRFTSSTSSATTPNCRMPFGSSS